MPLRTTRDLASLGDALRELDGRGYKAYKSIEGCWEGGFFTLLIDHVQGDPFADPTRLRARLDPAATGLPAWAVSTSDRRRATADFLNRVLFGALSAASTDAGSGNSGELRVLRPGQQILRRTALLVDGSGSVEARFRVGLPAAGRRILGGRAAQLLTEVVPAAVGDSLGAAALDLEALRRHIETVEDACALRAQLAGRRLVAFVADGARLARRSGVDDGPLEAAGVVAFRSPESLRVALPTPNSGTIGGMGIPAGVTLVVGGGYHGKSTLLRALERGVYDHVPGDGRERVVAVATAVKVRAEDGRRVAGTDISAFIGRLPDGTETERFETDNASGSTSQAAAIAEALEVGCGCLLLDEDTSATNFMIRDARTQALIADEHEPITPYIDRARQLYEELGVSTILVVGGSGDYFDVADTVIAMRRYNPEDVTGEARAVAARFVTMRRREGGPLRSPRPRIPDPASIDPARGRHPVRITVRARDRVEFGRERVDLGGLDQIVESAQTRAIAHAVAAARGDALDGERDLREALEWLLRSVEERGLDIIHAYPIGEHAEFRIFELAGFLNRLRSLRTR